MPHISELYQRRKENHANVGGSIWDEMSLKEAPKILLDQDSVQGTICLIIDGLDECHEGEDEGLEYLLDLIDSTASKTLRVRACISSRPLPLIEDRLRGISGFRIQEWTAPDISKYVSCKMDEALQLAKQSSNQPIVEAITAGVVDRSAGVFIWVKWVIRELYLGIREGQKDTELIALLNSLPEELERLYERIFDMIQKKGFLRKALSYLQIVDINLRGFPSGVTLLEIPIMDCTLEGVMKPTNLEILHLKDLEDTRQRTKVRMQPFCRGLLDFSPHSSGLDVPGNLAPRITHLTLKEFLKSKGISAKFQEERATALARCMLGYVKLLKTCEVSLPDFYEDQYEVAGIKYEVGLPRKKRRRQLIYLPGRNLAKTI